MDSDLMRRFPLFLVLCLSLFLSINYWINATDGLKIVIDSPTMYTIPEYTEILLKFHLENEDGNLILENKAENLYVLLRILDMNLDVLKDESPWESKGWKFENGYYSLSLSLHYQIEATYLFRIRYIENGTTSEASLSFNIESQGVSLWDCGKCHDEKFEKMKVKTPHSKKTTSKERIESRENLAQISIPPYNIYVEVGQNWQQFGAFGMPSWFYGSLSYTWWWLGEQKNGINIFVLEDGLPVSDLAPPLSWYQCTNRFVSPNNSWKADSNCGGNYPDSYERWMHEVVDLTGYSSATLGFWEWFNLESDWDYGWVLVSTDGGNTWNSLSGTYITNTDPNSNNIYGNGITGDSGGWVFETMDLTSYVNQEIIVAFYFKSDTFVNYEGWYIDDVSINGLVIDDAETPLPPQRIFITVNAPTIPGGVYNTVDIPIFEDSLHPGFYYGEFQFSSYGSRIDFTGLYTIDIRIDSTTVSSVEDFEVPMWGCENCHFPSYGYIPHFPWACSSCHTSVGSVWVSHPHTTSSMHRPENNSQFGNGCLPCHTNVVVDIKYGSSVYDPYDSHTINLLSGAHSDLSCEDCHGELGFQGAAQYTISDELGYSPEFRAYQSNVLEYLIDYEEPDDLNVTLTWTSSTSVNIEIKLLGDYASGQNPTYAQASDYNTSGVLNLNVTGLSTGIYVLDVVNYNNVAVEYTISSSHPIKRVIKVPYQCSQCHPISSTAAIPNWDRFGASFTHRYQTSGHTPTDGHVQCRFCHGSFHSIKPLSSFTCQSCHASPPTLRFDDNSSMTHPIQNPSYSSMDYKGCLSCHQDPHILQAQGAGPVSISPKAIAKKIDRACARNVIFDASLSFDPDGEIVSYYWDFG
ncbi:MAG: hypothetical protein ACE5K0_08235, partial [Candidatus Methanofastidiosia archaeon]